MKEQQRALDEAIEAAQASRAQLARRAAATTTRLKPARLVADAKGAAQNMAKQSVQDSIDHARNHPFRFGFAVAGLALWAARRPLIARATPNIQTAYAWLAGNLPFMSALQRWRRDRNEP